jgi:hypothetical protein
MIRLRTAPKSSSDGDALEGVIRCSSKVSALLVTGEVDEALRLARTIAERAGFWDRVRHCDPNRMQPECVHPPDGREVLLVRNVDALTPRQQAWLMGVLEHPGAGGAPRIVATASPALFMRVQDGTFAERLYYRLNMLQLAASDVTLQRGRPLRVGSGEMGMRRFKRLLPAGFSEMVW